jgi:hypothetical protein
MQKYLLFRKTASARHSIIRYCSNRCIVWFSIPAICPAQANRKFPVQLYVKIQIIFEPPFWKWRSVEIFRCQESIRDIIIYTHIKCCWNRTMLNLCGILATILKMVTGRNFSMSGHHNLPQIQHCPISTTFHMCVDYDVPNWFLTSKKF